MSFSQGILVRIPPLKINLGLFLTLHSWSLTIISGMRLFSAKQHVFNIYTALIDPQEVPHIFATDRIFSSFLGSRPIVLLSYSSKLQGQSGRGAGRATALPLFCLGWFFRARKCMINGEKVTSNACLLWPGFLTLPL